MSRNGISRVLTLALGATAGFSFPAAAQSAGPDGIETVVVTAEKREERLQDLPMAATVISGKQLEDQKITDISQLSLSTPTFVSHPGNGGFLTIRGLGTESYARSAQGDVAVILDGVAVSGGANPQDPASLYDVERVEVLEGPQSTLFGTSAAAGAINIVTKTPELSTFSGQAHLDLDDRDGLTAQAVVNIPVSDDAALRISGHEQLDPHEIFNNFDQKWNDGHNGGVRARFLYEPNDQLTVNFIADYNKTRISNYNLAVVSAVPDAVPLPPGSVNLGPALAACGVVVNRNNDHDCLDGNSFYDFEDYGVSGQIDYRFGDGTTLTSITADRVGSTKNNFDTDETQFDLFNVNDATIQQNSFSQELRLTSASQSRLEYVAGLYFLTTHLSASGDQQGNFNNTGLLFSGLTAGNSFDLHSNSDTYAGYGQATYRLTDALSLIGGLRFTYDSVTAHTTKSVTPGSVLAIPGSTLDPIIAATNDSDLSGKVGAQYQVDPDWMLYATASKGYKGPAINDQASNLGVPGFPVPLVVKPEQVYNYEAGTRIGFFDQRLQFSATAYYEDIRDYQVQIYDRESAQFLFGNARSASVKGVDLSAYGSVTDNLFLSAGINYNDATFGNGTVLGCGPTQPVGVAGCAPLPGGAGVDVGGRSLLGSPKWKFVSFGEYHHGLDFWNAEGFLQADAVYSDAVTYSAVYDPGDSYPANWLIGSRLGIRSADGRWSVAVFVRNLLNQRVPTAIWDTPIAGLLGSSGSHAQVLNADSFRRVGISLDISL